MKRYAHLRRLAPLGGLMAAAVVALSAAPAGATVVCQAGHTPPTPPATSPYCTNVKPTAVTSRESNVKSTSATLNGTAGATVAGGDPTSFFWQFGTSTSYGSQTATGTLGACPSGVSPPSPYCSTPAATNVTANLSGLAPCTTYHDRIVASNPDGTTFGSDSAFTTGFAKPISNVKAPNKVKHGKKFTVKFTAKFAAKFKIFIKNKHGKIVESVNLGFHRPGNIKKKIKAPNKKGKYKLVVLGKESCGKQSVKKKLKVH